MIDIDDVHAKSFEMMKIMRQQFLEPILNFRNGFLRVNVSFEEYEVSVLYAQHITPVVQYFLSLDHPLSVAQRFDVLKDCVECSKNSKNLVRKLPAVIPLLEQSVQNAKQELDNLKKSVPKDADVYDHKQHGPRARYLKSVQDTGGYISVDINMLLDIQQQLVQSLVDDAQKICNSMSQPYVSIDTQLVRPTTTLKKKSM